MRTPLLQRLRPRLCAGLVAASCSAAAPAVALGDAGARALRLAGEGRCEAALPELDAARDAGPSAADDARLALRAGQCRMRLHRYEAAVRDLADAARLAPDDPEAQLSLAKASYHARDLPRARRALDAAQALRPDDAEVALYRGMLQIETGDDRAAIASLERALRLDPERVEPVASLQLALARARTRDTDRAEALLRGVATRWPDTDWSTRAEQELSRLRARDRRHLWLSLGAGFEHDTNVVLRGRGLPEPADISNDRDQRGVWLGSTGAELWKGERATVGAMASYRGTTHADLHDFDAHVPGATAWLDLVLSEQLRANARYDFAYAWLDGDPFLSTQRARLALQRAGSDWGSAQLYVGTHQDAYFYESDPVPDAVAGSCGGLPTCSPAGVDERSARRRSGWSVDAGIAHLLELDPGPLPLRAPSLLGGYDFRHFQARGSEYTHDAHTLRLALSAGLPLELGAELSGAFTWRPYRHPSTFPDPPLPTGGAPYALSGVRRREETLQLEALLSRRLTEQVGVSARWRYVDNHSNVDVFDYEQQVFGVYVDLTLGREL